MSDLQTAADRHLLEKSQIRDTLGLLRIYHKSGPRYRLQTALDRVMDYCAGLERVMEV